VSTPNANTIVISDCDPDGIKTAIQAEFESARASADTINDATDQLGVSPSQAGDSIAPDVSTLEEEWPLDAVSVSDIQVPTVSDIFADWPLATDTVSGRRDIDLNGTL
jgi:hypothetical protein